MGGISSRMGSVVSLRESRLVHLKHCGSVNRVVRYRTTHMNDFYFGNFVLAEFGVPVQEIYNQYNKTQCNFNALMPSLLKYDRCGFTYDQKIWDKATEFTIRHFSLMGDSKIISLDEAIENMEGKSSPGYPFSLLAKSKKELFKHSFVKDVIKDFDERIQKEETPVLWAVNEKDEIRDIGKLETNRIRTFVGSPVDLLASMMRLFFDMNTKMYEQGDKYNWSFVGATKYFGGWDHLARRLSKHKNTYELDETDYDCSLDEVMLNTCAYIRFKMLSFPLQTAENWKYIQNVYKEIIHSFMVCPGGDILQKCQGNPSGSFNTIADNVLVLFTLLSFAWLILAPESMQNYDSFITNVEATLCGDDNTWSVSDKAHPFFNAKSVAFVWTQMGITTKSDFWFARPLTECWFMSSGFKIVDHPYYDDVKAYVPYPETQKVLCSLAYHNKGGSARWSLLRACALRLDSFWNEECRMILQNFIIYIQLNYMTELRAPQNPDDPLDMFTYEQVMSVYRTDEEIVQLYFGCEGALKLQPHKNE